MADGAPLDLKNISFELEKRDKRINELLSDRMRLKNLLKKAKGALDNINLKYRQTQEKLT